MKLKFEQKEFDVLRKFQNRMNAEFGETAYVGTDHATVLLDYSPELKAMLRPMPASQNFEFVIRQLKCSDCPAKQMFVCLDSQTEFLCSPCADKRIKKNKKS